MDEATYDGLMGNSIPYHEYIAVNKLVTWVQQVESCTSVTVLGNGVTVSLFSRYSSLRCPSRSRANTRRPPSCRPLRPRRSETACWLARPSMRLRRKKWI
jgi:hypothetical protein